MAAGDRKKGDLSITALYTSQTWIWGGLSCAGLFATKEAKAVFDTTNAALAAARLVNRGLTSLPHALVHRHAMIDHLLAEAAPGQVLELAAGLSRRGAAFSQEAAMRYTEVDLPQVMAKKKALLERTQEGRDVAARPNLRLVGADVEQAPLEGWVVPGQPLFVIAEGLMMYLSREEQRALWARVARLFARAAPASFVFDLVPTREQPAPGAVGRALEAAMKRFTGGRTFARDNRTRDDIAAELREVGFGRVDLVEPAAVARSWGLPFADVPTQQLLFVCRA